MFNDSNSYTNLGKHIFDIHIQGVLVLKDFNIAEEAKGDGKTVVKTFPVTLNKLRMRPLQVQSRIWVGIRVGLTVFFLLLIGCGILWFNGLLTSKIHVEGACGEVKYADLVHSRLQAYDREETLVMMDAKLVNVSNEVKMEVEAEVEAEDSSEEEIIKDFYGIADDISEISLVGWRFKGK
ncbi:hypothetical protein DY000_02026631 [Brassica cretica]|uniref:Malectin domain-containing protein n=1 Tax=Brassica cretica TaxID=69181 RepID=A0ABQ7E7H5_BRACR|nr:hypothetical protein DY000_02026631 [Brassica cretica]